MKALVKSRMKYKNLFIKVFEKEKKKAPTYLEVTACSFLAL